MTAEEIALALRLNGNATSRKCFEAIREERLSPTFPPLGSMTAAEALTLYRHRRETMVAARIPFEGLDTFLEEVGAAAPNERLTLAGFSGDRESCVVFLDGRAKVLGCVWIGKGKAGL